MVAPSLGAEFASRRRQDAEGLDRLRTEDGMERPGMARFRSGPGLNERRFRAGPDFEPGYFIPAGLEAIPGRYGPCRTRPNAAHLSSYRRQPATSLFFPAPATLL